MGRQGKMSTLSQLLIRSKFWLNPDPEAPEEEKWLGLSAPVTALQQPVLSFESPIQLCTSDDDCTKPLYCCERYFFRVCCAEGIPAAFPRHTRNESRFPPNWPSPLPA